MKKTVSKAQTKTDFKKMSLVKIVVKSYIIEVFCSFKSNSSKILNVNSFVSLAYSYNAVSIHF